MRAFVQYFLTFYCEFIFGHINVGFEGNESSRGRNSRASITADALNQRKVTDWNISHGSALIQHRYYRFFMPFCVHRNIFNP